MSELVFIPGAGSNADFWHWQKAEFPDAHYLDLPGHDGRRSGVGGRGSGINPKSGRPLGHQNLKLIVGYADWVEGYVRDRGLRDVVLDGHSMGGAIALAVALRKPGWLRGLVLTGTGARLRVSPKLLTLLSTDYEAAVDMIMRLSFAPSEALSYAQQVRLNGARRQLLRTPQEVTLHDYEACARFDVMARLGEIDVPVLCVVGAEDKMTPPGLSRALSEGIEGARLEIVEGAGHMLPVEKAEEYNRLVAGFLSGLAIGGAMGETGL